MKRVIEGEIRMKRIIEDFLWIFIILITPSFVFEKLFFPLCKKEIERGNEYGTVDKNEP